MERRGAGDPSRLRISDDDRHKVAEHLRHAAGEGRIDLAELEERLEATYAAKTYADLVPITADLPMGQSTVGAPVRPSASALPAAGYGNSFAVMSSTTRKGLWTVPDVHSAFAMMGSVELDLREAQFESTEVVINAAAVMGSVDVVVNAHTVVVVEGFGLMGDFSEGRSKVPAQPTAQSPVVRLKGLALMGSVCVRRKPMPGEPKKLGGRW